MGIWGAYTVQAEDEFFDVWQRLWSNRECTDEDLMGDRRYPMRSSDQSLPIFMYS